MAQSWLDRKYFAWAPANDPNRPPYRGLLPLEADNAGIFFGREAPVIDALDRLRGLREAPPPRLLVILTASRCSAPKIVIDCAVFCDFGSVIG